MGPRLEPVDTPHGPASVHLHPADEPKGALVLGHGAGGGVESRDLVAVAEVAVAEGVSVALVEQPYRVAGRRSPAPARQLDAAWTAVVDRLARKELSGLPLVLGGRSLGARVACRTVEGTGAVAVLCLAFPLQPPQRSGSKPSPSRLPELDAVTLPMLVVQGERDRFGMPPATARRTVVQVPGDHSLRTDVEAVAAAVRDWLPGVVGQALRIAARP
jgi:predicted alpha/beta-hydrolase family hydrolase